jgi:hypothetical protein
VLQSLGHILRESFRTSVKLMVNLKFAVGLLSLIGVVSIYATILGGIHGEEAQAAVFNGPFFTGLMIVFTFALALALASRWPWKKTHIGWILTHTGLITIVFGHMATARLGREGRVDLMEGQSTSFMEQSEWLLTADVPRFGARMATRVSLDLPPDTPLEGRAYQLPGGDVLAIERFWPTYSVRTRVSPDFTEGAPPRPAVQVEIRAGKRKIREWLYADEPEESGKALGAELRIHHVRVETAEEHDALVAGESPPGVPSGGFLVMEEGGAEGDGHAHGGGHGHGGAAGAAGRIIARVPLEEARAGEAPVGTSGYKIRIDKVFERLRLVDNKPTEGTDGPLNPAVIVLVRDPSGKFDRRWVFADHGEIPGADALALPFRIAYVPAGSARAAGGFGPSTVALLEGPGRRPTVLVVENDGTRRTSPLEIGRPIPLPWLGAEAAFIDRYERAFPAREPWCSSYAANRPALLVSVRPPPPPARGPAQGMGAGGGSGEPRPARPEGQQAWVVWSPGDEATTVVGSQGPIELRLAPKRVALGFTIQLSDFVLQTYEGTESPMSFESYVRVIPHDGKPPFDYHIYMNHPLTHEGYTFFQSSYDPETLRRSIFQVSYDPGWPVVYLGYALLTLGLAFVVYVKPVLIRREAERRAALGLARAAEKRAEAGAPAGEGTPSASAGGAGAVAPEGATETSAAPAPSAPTSDQGTDSGGASS